MPIKITLSVVSLACLLWHAGFYAGCPLVNHAAYTFCHTNVFHLAINLTALWSIKNKIDIIPSLLIAIAASFLPMYVSAPTMGMSGFLFAAFGLMWGKTGRMKDAAKTVMPFIVTTMIFPNINGLLHLYCFWTGYAAGFVREKMRAAVRHG